jgi:hypothetical protein
VVGIVDNAADAVARFRELRPDFDNPRHPDAGGSWGRYNGAVRRDPCRGSEL